MPGLCANTKARVKKSRSIKLKKCSTLSARHNETRMYSHFRLEVIQQYPSPCDPDIGRSDCAKTKPRPNPKLKSSVYVAKHLSGRTIIRSHFFQTLVCRKLTNLTSTLSLSLFHAFAMAQGKTLPRLSGTLSMCRI
jgi:hypothetical protein